MIDPDEKILSLRDIAMCSAAIKNRWIQSFFYMVVEELLGHDAALQVLKLEMGEQE
jgi:hypothetical protein